MAPTATLLGVLRATLSLQPGLVLGGSTAAFIRYNDLILFFWDHSQPDAEAREKYLRAALFSLCKDLALLGYLGWSQPEKITNGDEINPAVAKGSVAYILYNKSRFETTVDAYRFGTTDCNVIEANARRLELVPGAPVLQKARLLQDRFEVLRHALQRVFESEISITSDRDTAVWIDNICIGGILEYLVDGELKNCMADMEESGCGVWRWEHFERRDYRMKDSILMYREDVPRVVALHKVRSLPAGNINQVQRMHPKR